MDGFDDLLSSSRSALEVNPFANPFNNARSSSPDPWASYGQQHQQEDHSGFNDNGGFGVDEAFDSTAGYGATGGGDALKNDFGFTETEEERKEEERSAAALSPGPPLQLEDLEPNTPDESTFKTAHPQSPGFKESLDIDDADSGRHALKKEELGTPTSSVEPTREPTPVAVARTQSPPLSPPPTQALDQARSSTTAITTGTEIRSHPSSPATSTFSQSTSTAQKNRVISPLEYPSPSFTQSFASLALGGESIGGWQDSTSAFGGSTSVPSEPEPSVTTKEEEETKDEAVNDAKPTNSLQPLFVIAVDDPEKVGDPIRPYILYTVKTRTTSPLFSKSQFSVLRRYSDFLWLYEALTLNNPGVFVPPVPEKSSFGRFDSAFIQQRRTALERCIQKIANHPVLSRDTDLKLFLESDTFALDIKHRKTEIAQERGGLMSSIGQAVAGPRFYETDDWFDKKRTYLDSLESQLKGMVKAVEAVSKQRSETAVAIGEFALATSELSSSDLSQQLSHSLSVLSDVEKRAQDLQHEQSQDDAATFMNTAEEYIRIIGSVRLAFSSRIRCHAQWQSAEGELRRVKQVHEKARSQGKIPQERIGHSFAQIADAERKALDAKQEFEKCGKLIKNEMARFEEERIHDFKESLEAFLEGMIDRQKQLITAWVNYQEVLLKKANANTARQLNSESAAVA